MRPCVDSILAQSYTNLEIILVNDGSPDKCGEICNEYARQDPRIKVIHKSNGGLSDARNAGLDIAKGEYIAFLDGDDLAHRDWLLTLYQCLKEHNAAIAFCNYQTVEGNHFDTTKEIQATKTECLDGLSMLYNLYNPRWIPKNIVVWNKLYKSEIFSQLRFRVGKVNEDEYIFVPLYAEPRRIVYTDFVGVGYVSRKESIMGNRYTVDKWNCLKEYGQEREAYFKENGMYDLLAQHRSKENKMMAKFLISGRLRVAYREWLSKRLTAFLSDTSVRLRVKKELIKTLILASLRIISLR